MNEHYRGFIDTCTRFGMAKQAADLLYKRAFTANSAFKLFGGSTTRGLGAGTMRYARKFVNTNANQLSGRLVGKFNALDWDRRNLAAQLRSGGISKDQFRAAMQNNTAELRKVLFGDKNSIQAAWNSNRAAFVDPYATARARNAFANFDTRGQALVPGRRSIPLRRRVPAASRGVEPAVTARQPAQPQVQQPAQPQPKVQQSAQTVAQNTAAAESGAAANATGAAGSGAQGVADQAMNEMANGNIVPMYGSETGAWMAQNPGMATLALGVPAFMLGSYMSNRNRA